MRVDVRTSMHGFNLEGQVFRFIKGEILRFITTVIFTVSWDFMQCFLRNTMSESAETSRKFNKSEIFNYEFYFKII